MARPILFMGVTGTIPIDGQLSLGESTGIDMPGEVWVKFHREKHLIPRIVGGWKLGVATLGDAPEGYFSCFADAEVEQGEENGLFIIWQLPATDYVSCGLPDARSMELWMPVSAKT